MVKFEITKNDLINLLNQLNISLYNGFNQQIRIRYIYNVINNAIKNNNVKHYLINTNLDINADFWGSVIAEGCYDSIKTVITPIQNN